MAKLTGKHVAVLSTDGFEDSEMTSPIEALVEQGATVEVIAPESGTITGKKGHVQDVDSTTDQADVAKFDGLLLPGGVNNGDKIRMNGPAVELVRAFFEEAKPVAVICHGGWILTDADVLKGRTVTSYPSLKTDLRNAGAEWVDEEVVVDRGLISSRTPADLPAFNEKFVEELSK